MTYSLSGSKLKEIDYPGVGVISLAHVLNDMYSNYLPALLPFLALSLGVTATKAAILVSVFSMTSYFVQPFFGYFLDQQGIRWFVHVGTLWMAVFLSLTGLIKSFPLLVLIVGLAGLGTAAFHPQASTMVSVISGQKKAVLLSCFVACGNIGFALSLLFLPPYFERFGLESTVYTVIPGLIVALLLYFFAPKAALLKGTSTNLREVFQTLSSASQELLIIIAVISIRTLAYFGLLALFPLYFSTKELLISWNNLMFIMLFCGAIGGIIGGYLSDRYGRKKLIVTSLVLTTPLLFGFFFTSGLLSTILLALAGASLLSSFSVTVVAAQETIPKNKSMASAISMGFSVGLGSLAVIPIGGIGDLFGLSTAIMILFSLPLIAGLLAIFIKQKAN
ncbi:MAG: MFS transporter [Desulfitobacteriia bacterium]|jgi:FSR family fosmidomycin resistance protein-like MFS transporter